MLNADIARRRHQRRLYVPLASRCAGAAHAERHHGAAVNANSDLSALQLAQLVKRVRPELDLYMMSNRRGRSDGRQSRRRMWCAGSSMRSRSCSSCISPSWKASRSATRRRSSTISRNTRSARSARSTRCRSRAASRCSSPTGSATWASSTASTCSWPRAAPPPAASTACWSRPATSRRRRTRRRARFGADHVFFVTNGTSTSNKMAVQALLAPGDIAIVDRNCHKSHHYGMVLSGAQPLYVEAFPMTEYSMYGAVPLRTIKQALLNLKADGRLDRVKMLDLTNCTFDGHIYNTRRVMEECLAIKPDLIFLWDEAWFGFARFSPFLRPRTAMGAANDIEAWMHDPNSVAGLREAAGRARRQAVRRDAAEHAAHPRSAPGQAARLPDQFDPQVDVGDPPGLDAARSRTSISTPSRRSSRRRCSPTPRPARTSS